MTKKYKTLERITLPCFGGKPEEPLRKVKVVKLWFSRLIYLRKMDQPAKNTSVFDGPITKAQYGLLVHFLTYQTLPKNEEIRRAGFGTDSGFREKPHGQQQAPVQADEKARQLVQR